MIGNQLTEALNRSLSDPLAMSASDDVCRLEGLAQQCTGQALEGYALSLAVVRLHDARDSYLALDRLNLRLLAWRDAQERPMVVPAALASKETSWQLVLGDGLAMAALHSDATTRVRDTLCRAHIDRLAETNSPEIEIQRLRLRGLTTALAYSQLAGNLSVRLELDAIAAHCIAALPNNPFEVGRWWVERTLMEIFTFLTERRAESSITDLLTCAERELILQPDAITQFKQCRNLFEWARVGKDVPRARQALEALQKARVAVPSRCRALNIVLLRTKAAMAMEEFDHIGAERFVREAIVVADAISASSNQRMALWSTLLFALATQERPADAAFAAEKAASYALSQHRDILTVLSHLLHARAKWLTEYPSALLHLHAALQLARPANYSQFLVVNPPMAAWLAARALDHAIEPAFVVEVITSRTLVPPEDAGPQWPWAVRVRLLGGCSVEGEGVNLAGAGKAQQKPLDIIQLLAIAGPRGLDRANLARAIYGSAMLDSPATLNMAISRARRLLGDDSLIDSQNGRICLDAGRVYVDLWAMRALKPTSDDEASWNCNRLLELYSGPLLQGSMHAEKHRVATATFRDRFIALMVALSAKMLPDQAIDVLRRAVAREPTAEALYRALIERLAQHGEAAEAVEVYQQCELALSRAYGVAPSERTQRLVEGLKQNSVPQASPVAATVSKTRSDRKPGRRARPTASNRAKA